MKMTLALLLLVSASTSFAAKSDPAVLHKTCNLAVEVTTSSDGLNLFLIQTIKNVIPKKGYTLVESAAVTAENPAMGLKIDFDTQILGKKRGSCEATILQRGDALATDDAGMSLASYTKEKGNLKKVSNKCIAAVVEKIKNYPSCITSIGQTPAEPPVDPTPTPNPDPAPTDPNT